ncbi:MAG: hypothetical protein WD711_07290 [Dongiaceae bacterium]
MNARVISAAIAAIATLFLWSAAKADDCIGSELPPFIGGDAAIKWESRAFEQLSESGLRVWCFKRRIEVIQPPHVLRTRWEIANLVEWTVIDTSLQWQYCCDSSRNENDGPLEYGATGATIPTRVHRGDNEPIESATFSIEGNVVFANYSIPIDIQVTSQAIPIGERRYRYEYLVVNDGAPVRARWEVFTKELEYKAFDSPVWTNTPSFESNSPEMLVAESGYGTPERLFGDFVILTPDYQEILRLSSPGIVPSLTEQ